MAYTRRQRSGAELLFFPNGGAGLFAPDQPAFTTQNKNDVISIHTNKTISQAAGGFQIQLVPRQDYLTKIRSDDWVIIKLTNGYEGVDETMIGIVDTVRMKETVDSESGSVREVISISGRDYGKVFLNTTLVIDPILGKYVEPTFFPAEVLIRKFSDNVIPFKSPSDVIGSLLDRYHDGRIQCLPPFALAGRELQRHLGPTRGYIISNSNPNFVGSLWATMEQYHHRLLNEMWVDTVDGKPSLYVEERPFTKEAYAQLKAYEMEETEVEDSEFTKSETDVRNWFRVYPDAQYLPSEAIDVSQIGYVNNDSIGRSGLRKMEEVTNAFGQFDNIISTADDGFPAGLLEEFSGLLAQWHCRNDEHLSGTVTCRLRPDIRVGRRLDFTHNKKGMRYSFYIEGVSHSFSYPGAGKTSLSLTRGTPFKLKTGNIEHPKLLTLDDLLSQGFLQNLKNFSPPPPRSTL